MSQTPLSVRFWRFSDSSQTIIVGGLRGTLSQSALERRVISGGTNTFDREPIRIADDCVFHCVIVADIVGDLELQLSNWETTANGQGRIRPLKNKYRGAIEVVQWKDLVNDAWMRNSAMLHAAGLSRSKPTLSV